MHDPPDREPFQFDLKGALLIVTGCAVTLALWRSGVLNVCLAAWILQAVFLLALARGMRRRR